MNILITITGLLLRLPLLNQSLWLDESIQAIILKLRKVSILTYSVTDFQPPLYHYILDIWTRVFGYSEISLRAPSLIAGTLSVFLIYKLANLLFSKKVAIISALILATNPLAIYYSQEGRTYMLTTFFILGSFYYLFKSLKIKKTSLGYFIFTSLALWTSYVGWIAVFIQFIYLLKKRSKIIKSTLLSALTLVPWSPYLIKQIQIGQSTMVSSPQWSRVVGGFEWMRIPRTWIKFALGRITFENKKIYLTIVTFVASLHSFALIRSNIKKNKLIFSWLMESIIIALAISLFIPVYQYFRLLFTLPAYILLLSLGLAKRKPWLTYTVIILQITALTYFWVTPQLHREDWRSARDYITSLDVSNSTLALPSINQSAPLEYYLPDMSIISPVSDDLTGYEEIYYFNYAESLFDANKVGVENIVQNDFTLVREKTFSGAIHLFVYTKTNENNN